MEVLNNNALYILIFIFVSFLVLFTIRKLNIDTSGKYSLIFPLFMIAIIFIISLFIL